MILLDCKETAARLEVVAAELGDSARAVECARILRTGAAADKTSWPAERVRTFSLAFQDASMIIDAFANVASRDRLREALAGDSVMVPEGGNDEPRNHLWSLFLGSRFHEEGLSPRFADDGPDEHGEKKPDLFVTYEGFSLSVEAKRVRSFSKLRKHIRKAVEQIEAACGRGEAVAGFLALDLSFAVGQHPQSGLWSLPSRNALPHVRELLTTRRSDLLKQAFEIVKEMPGARHIVGVTILMLPVVHYADVGQVGLVRYFSTLELPGGPVAGRAAFRVLHDRCFADRKPE